ncbi:MAG: porin family protein [Balneolaceae bacterium]
MKKTIVLLVGLFFVLGFEYELQAQSQIKFGVRGGLNFANLGNADFETEPRTGFMAGMFANIPIPVLPFDLEAGINYSQKGVKTREERTELTFKLDYIEVPVLAKIHFAPAVALNPYFLAGPYIEFNVNAKSESRDEENRMSIDLSDETEFVNFGLVGGIGTDINVGISRVNIQGRFNLGLRNTFNDRFGGNENNMLFSILAGFTF